MTKRHRKTPASPRWKQRPLKDRRPPPPGAEPRPTRVKFYGGQFSPDELALIAACLQDPSVDDEIWMQRVLNLRLLRVAKRLAPGAEVEAEAAADPGAADEAPTSAPANPALTQLVHVAAALTNGAGRLARLLRDQRVLSGEAVDTLLLTLADVLDAWEGQLKLGGRP